ncbi:hypothetical protein OUZ56_008507 [Daphnia magna]|uniref:BPTI/Kunitz inhibitor domain-containing protein n=1 Tax=Daphnia magna TaxID=35525 RepID=A0ABR0AD68_9CRUS|nr:hypothetical protein OUZ56_008507 [Daphnia magna]
MQPTTIFGLLAFLASFCVFATSKPTSTGHYHHGTDIVTEILQAIDRREEMWRIATYLNASRDDLLNELPYLNADGTKINYTFFAPTSTAFLTQTPQDASDPMHVDAHFRRKVLLRHFVRHHVDDLTKVDTLLMADSTKAVVTRKSSIEICNLPPIQNTSTATCMAFFPSWTFNSKSGKCESYVYGGCHRTENLFDTEQDCLAKCGPAVNTIRSFLNETEVQTDACVCSELAHDFCTMFVVDRVFMDSTEVIDVLSKQPSTGQIGPFSLTATLAAPSNRTTSHGPSSVHPLRTTPLEPIGPMLVGYSSVSPSDPDVQEMAQFAVDELSRGAHSLASPLVLVNVISAEKQTVAGVNYKLKLSLRNAELGTLACDVVVFDQSCSSTCRVSSFKCDPSFASSIAPGNE